LKRLVSLLLASIGYFSIRYAEIIYIIKFKGVINVLIGNLAGHVTDECTNSFISCPYLIFHSTIDAYSKCDANIEDMQYLLVESLLQHAILLLAP